MYKNKNNFKKLKKKKTLNCSVNFKRATLSDQGWAQITRSGGSDGNSFK